MNVDIANMVVNVGEQLDKVNWLDAGVTFASVFLGALFAYKFGLKLELRKAKRVMRGDFCSLATQAHINFIDIIAYKNSYLDKIKEDLDKNNITAVIKATNYTGVAFSIDVDKYVFLNDCNRCLLPEITFVKALDNQIRKLWMDYIRMDTNFLLALQKKDEGAILYLKTSFLQIYDLYKQLCIRIYYMNKHLTQCYERFFNVNYSNDFEEDYEEEKKLIESIPDALTDENFIAMDEYFNKYWAPDHTLWEDIKYHYRKLKYRLKGLKIYFFGRGKPKTKPQNEGKK